MKKNARLFITLLFCILPTVFAEARLTADCALPYWDGDHAFVLSGIGYGDDSLVDAARFELRDTAEFDAPFALTAVSLRPGSFLFRGAVLQTPAASLPFPVDPLSVPLFSAGVERTWGELAVRTLVHGLYLPETVTEIESREVRARPACFPGITATVGFRDVDCSLTFLGGETWISVEDTLVGNAELSSLLLTAAWKDFGVFWLSAAGNLDVAAYALLTDSIGFTALVRGTADIDAVGTWGALRFRRGALAAELAYGLGLAWTGGTKLAADYTLNDDPEESRLYRIECEHSPFALAHVSVGYSFSPRFSVTAGRWLGYLSDSFGIRESSGAGDSTSGGGADSPSGHVSVFARGFAGLDWRTLIFSGCALSCTYVLP